MQANRFVMMVAVLLCLSVTQAVEFPAKTLEDARRLFDRGEYAESLVKFEALATDPTQDSVLKVRTNLGVVESQKALGNYEMALKRCQQILVEAPENFPAHYWQGDLLETTGKKQQAIESYRWFEPRVKGGSSLVDAEAITYAARGLDRYSLLIGKPAVYAKFILQDLLQKVYDTMDSNYWPARVASGNLLLSKYNLKQANDDFLAALKANPQCADAEVGLAQMELQQWQWEKCEQRVARALRKNPNHVGAMVTKATLLMNQREDEEAVTEVEKALAVNPNDLEALSLMAALQTRLRNEPKAQEFILREKKINPDYGMLHATIAEGLHALRQFNDAEKEFLKAIELSPELADPRTSLGLLYMETGHEEKARLMLDAAFRIDNFNRRTFNTLNLLDEVEKFQKVETAHFIIKFDGSKDRVLANYFGDYLEGIYPELTKKFEFNLPEKSIIEVFPTHERFAVRLTAMPWLQTVGACTGRVIGMDAPRRDARLTPFDWKDVLRHEFTHVITLTGTDNRISHWFTEGLATREQPLPREWMMTQIFVVAVRKGELFPLHQLDWGFIRPRKQTDRALAYTQSELICEYVAEKFGESKLLDLMRAYKAGKSQAAAFQEVFGRKEVEFDADFATWARRQVEKWGFNATPIREIGKIRSEVNANPNDANLLGELAEAQMGDSKFAEAEKTAAHCLALDPKNVRALDVSVKFLGGSQKWDEAKPQLERLQQENPKSLIAAKWLGEIALKNNQLDLAVTHFRRLTQLCPSDPEGHKGLAEAYKRQGKLEEALPSWLALEVGNTTDLQLPQQIAATYKKMGKLPEATRALEAAMRLDPYDIPMHQKLASLYLDQKNYAAAIREFQVNCDLQPLNADHFARLASVYKQSGNRDQAIAAARKAVGMDPHSPATAILEGLEKNSTEGAIDGSRKLE